MKLTHAISTALSLTALVAFPFMSYAHARYVPESVTQSVSPLPREYIISERELKCLAENIYFEARGENTAGQMAVGYVTLNRVASSHYPNTVCAVVHQGRRDSNGEPILHQCQFSWFCDGKSDKIRNEEAWNEVTQVAIDVMTSQLSDPTRGAIMYHSKSVDPYWTDDYSFVTKIGGHLFYK